jgi:hypothetical protein
VEAFIGQYGAKLLSGRRIYVIGEPTRSAIPVRLRKKVRLLPLASMQNGF